MTNANKQVQLSTQYILNLTETPRKAFAVSAIIDFFLQSEEDRQQFVTRWINGYKGNMKTTTAIMKLCKEIGGYHYTYNDYSDLLHMDTKKALECIFQQPINESMLFKFIGSKASIAQMFTLNQTNQDCKHFMTALAYV